MASRVHISDLDGTLLQADATLSAFAREALTRLLGEGLRFTVASARSVVSMRQILGDLPLTLPVIECNGAFLTEYLSGERLLIRDLPGEVAHGAHAIGAEQGLAPIVSTTDGRRDHLNCQGVSNAGIEWYVAERIQFHDERYRAVPDVGPHLAERVTMLTFIDRAEALMPLREAIHARFDGRVMTDFYENRYSPGWHWLTVQGADVSKGAALRSLAEIAGFDLADTVAFGDAANDVSLLEAAGHGVAVANASPALRDLADEGIGPHTEDSVVRWILGTRAG